MKALVPVTLIICGTILVSLPYLDSTISMNNMTALILATKSTVNLTGPLTRDYYTYSALGGFLMILAGALLALRKTDVQKA